MNLSRSFFDSSPTILVRRFNRLADIYLFMVFSGPIFLAHLISRYLEKEKKKEREAFSLCVKAPAESANMRWCLHLDLWNRTNDVRSRRSRRSNFILRG